MFQTVNNLFCDFGLTSIGDKISIVQAIYAAMGVPELWRCDRGVVQFLQLQGGKYLSVERSVAFPILPVTELNKFLAQSQTVGETTLLRSFRAWVKQTLETLEN